MAESNSTSESERLTAALNALRSEDGLIQNEGVVAAIQIGSASVPGLLLLLDERGISRAQVMYALAQIGDSRGEQAFLAGLRDGDDRVRAYAAQGLVRLGHPDAMTASLQTLNDAADEMHLDMTPAVAALGEMGIKAVPALLQLLMDPDETTRLHGQRALELMLSRRYGFRPSQGFPSQAAAEGMRTEWKANGDYHYSANADARSAAVAMWHRWLANAPD